MSVGFLMFNHRMGIYLADYLCRVRNLIVLSIIIVHYELHWEPLFVSSIDGGCIGAEMEHCQRDTPFRLGMTLMNTAIRVAAVLVGYL